MQKVLITGAAGFIGSHVCEALLQAGCQVVGVDSFNDYYNPQIKQNNVHLVQQCALHQASPDAFCMITGDIRDRAFMEEVFAVHRPDAVIHLAAYAGVRPSIANAPLYIDVNVNGTLNILELMRSHQVKKLVFASSSSVYGNNPQVPFKETDIVDFPISPYAASKKSGELLCHTYHHLYDMHIACLRFFTVYGPRQRPDLAIHKFTDCIMNNQPISLFGDGSTKRDYTYIADSVDGVMKALSWLEQENPCYSIFNLGESQVIALAEMVSVLERALGKKAVIHHCPEQPGDVKITYADIHKARTVLGYAPCTAFADGIAKFVEWYDAVQTNI